MNAGDICPHGNYWYAEVESENPQFPVGSLSLDCDLCTITAIPKETIMSDQTNETESEQKTEIPAAAMDPIAMVTTLTQADIEAKTVGCSTCPVFLLCESSSYGSGYTCGKCKTTGVLFSTDNEDEVMVVDCAKHKFPTKADGGTMAECTLCNGQIMKQEYRSMPPKNYIILTENSAVPLDVRLEKLKDSLKHWKEHFAETAAREEEEKKKFAEKKSK